MGIVSYLVIVAAFLGVSWLIRYIVSQDVSRRVDRKLAEESAGFCSWPREG